MGNARTGSRKEGSRPRKANGETLRRFQLATPNEERWLVEQRPGEFWIEQADDDTCTGRSEVIVGDLDCVRGMRDDLSRFLGEEVPVPVGARERVEIDLEMLPPPTQRFDRQTALEWLEDEGIALLWAMSDAIKCAGAGQASQRDSLCMVSHDVAELFGGVLAALQGARVELRQRPHELEGDVTARMVGLARVVSFALEHYQDCSLQGRNGFALIADALEQRLRAERETEEAA